MIYAKKKKNKTILLLVDHSSAYPLLQLKSIIYKTCTVASQHYFSPSTNGPEYYKDPKRSLSELVSTQIHKEY